MIGPVVIHWYRRDLRIEDNRALMHAAESGLPVVPVYFLSGWQGKHEWTGAKRQQFLCGCLGRLARGLELAGSRLILREGDEIEGLRELVNETGAVAVHVNGVPDPHGRRNEERLRRLAEEMGIECRVHLDATLHGPEEVLTQNGQPYRVYTPFSKNWLALPKQEPGEMRGLGRVPMGLRSLPVPEVSRWGLERPDAQMPEPGEQAALKRLHDALGEKLRGYAAKRNFPALDGTAGISQDLRFGLVSIRRIYAEAVKLRQASDASGREGVDVFIKELAWREFYFAILHHYPEVLDHEFNPDWRMMAWDEPGEFYECWKQGRTGFPMVDAGMRELLATGLMHNRLRMITAMFLTKDLHHDWKLGESFFMQHLLDGEIASNNGGWQWSAGTGADAAPYFRIQNPWLQGARYDPDGAYIRRWVPELARVVKQKLHEPPKDGRPIAEGYPLPCVDHSAERDRTMEIFRRHAAARGR